MKDQRFIPPHFINLMSPEDRKKFGVHTAEEIQADNNLKTEREIHSQFFSWLRRHGFTDFYHSDPVRRPTIQAGLPDFGIYRDSRIIFIEFKVKPNGLSEVQESVFQRMGASGNVILICYSYDEARRAVAKFFHLDQ
jgi:hypothetical protein